MKATLLISLASIMLSRAALSCCGFAAPGIPVTFKSQSNIVIWDEKSKTEHFIRNASFSTQAEALGFIAPTPSVPEIKEVDSQAFSVLRAMSPFEEDHPKMSRDSGGFGGGGSKVEVVQQVDAAGYRITTLKATDAKALAQWMRANKFATSESIEEWTRFYLRKQWYLNLFKVLKENGDHKTGTVRLSFKTERPFNPYLVPKVNFAQRQADAGLELFLITNGRYEGAIADKQYGSPHWVENLNKPNAEALALQLKLNRGTVSQGMRVACYKDPAFPRQTEDDIVFYPVDASGRIKDGAMALNSFQEILNQSH